MGYDYYILIQGKKDGKWYDLDYKSCSGTYGAVNNHYFYTESNKRRSVGNMEFSQPMGEYQHIFTYECMKEDYDKHTDKRGHCLYVDVKNYVTNVIKKNLTYETIVELKDYLEEFISELDHPSRNVTELYVSELVEYFEQCRNYKEQYGDVRIIFGFSP